MNRLSVLPRSPAVTACKSFFIYPKFVERHIQELENQMSFAGATGQEILNTIIAGPDGIERKVNLSNLNYFLIPKCGAEKRTDPSLTRRPPFAPAATRRRFPWRS